jgi:hypothetical protein
MSKAMANFIKPVLITGCLLGALAFAGCSKANPSPAVPPVVGTLQLFFEPGQGIRTTDNAATIIGVFTTAGVTTVQSMVYLTNPANPRQINIYRSIQTGFSLTDGGTFDNQGAGWKEALVYQLHLENSYLDSTCLSGNPLSPANVSKLCCAAAMHECGHAFDLPHSGAADIMNGTLAGAISALRAGAALPTFTAAQVTEMNRKLGLPYP